MKNSENVIAKMDRILGDKETYYRSNFRNCNNPVDEQIKLEKLIIQYTGITKSNPKFNELSYKIQQKYGYGAFSTEQFNEDEIDEIVEYIKMKFMNTPNPGEPEVESALIHFNLETPVCDDNYTKLINKVQENLW